MQHRFATAAIAALLLWTVVPAVAQNGNAASKSHGLRRMPDGHPDLQGTYDLATITPLERSLGAKAVLTKEEAAKLEAAMAQQRAQGDQPLKGDRTAPPKGGDGSL